MGEAWLARDAERGEEVVAKVVPPGAPPERLALLRREARLVRKLAHPRIVPVYGFRSGERGSARHPAPHARGRRGEEARVAADRGGQRSAATWPRRSSTSTASGSSTAT